MNFDNSYKLTLNKKNLFFTSDTHFGHANIIKYCNRPFASVEEMDEDMIKNWNSVVTNNDHVFHLGDVSFHKPEKTKSILDRLNGKIYLLRGNHEKPALDGMCIKRFEWVKDYFKLNVDIGESKTQKVIMSHYPFLSWDESHRGSYNFYGHCHGGIPKEVDEQHYRVDVGVDCWGFYPVSFDTLHKELQKRESVELRKKNDTRGGEI
jgi:calcineurin-like phosphoesterase family protein